MRIIELFHKNNTIYEIIMSGKEPTVLEIIPCQYEYYFDGISLVLPHKFVGRMSFTNDDLNIILFEDYEKALKFVERMRKNG